jgi:hypothetical protein
MPPSLSRTSSMTSTATNTSSDDLYATFINESTDATTRRTRKRFTNAQLMMLEQLFHENSHPSREQRESVARSANMFVSCSHRRVASDAFLFFFIQGSKVCHNLVPEQAADGAQNHPRERTRSPSSHHQHQSWQLSTRSLPRPVLFYG